jgi:hypothetical protein
MEEMKYPYLTEWMEKLKDRIQWALETYHENIISFLDIQKGRSKDWLNYQFAENYTKVHFGHFEIRNDKSYLDNMEDKEKMFKNFSERGYFPNDFGINVNKYIYNPYVKKLSTLFPVLLLYRKSGDIDYFGEDLSIPLTDGGYSLKDFTEEELSFYHTVIDKCEIVDNNFHEKQLSKQLKEFYREEDEVLI